MRHLLRFAGAWCVAISCCFASTVTVSTTDTGTVEHPQITTTITVTPAPGEGMTRFHINPTAPGSRLPVGATFGQPTHWGAPTGSGSEAKGKHWKAIDDSHALSSGESTFTIALPGTTSDYGWSSMAWTASSNRSLTRPNPGEPGYVDGGTSSVTTGGGIPIKSIALSGPSTVSIGQLAMFRVGDALLPNSSMTYTVRFCRSLESADPARVNVADPVLDASGYSFSTNSRTGTTTPSEGVRQATAFGDDADVVIIDVPEDSSLIGQTIYLQVEFADGDVTAPVALLVTS